MYHHRKIFALISASLFHRSTKPIPQISEFRLPKYYWTKSLLCGTKSLLLCVLRIMYPKSSLYFHVCHFWSWKYCTSPYSTYPFVRTSVVTCVEVDIKVHECWRLRRIMVGWNAFRIQSSGLISPLWNAP